MSESNLPAPYATQSFMDLLPIGVSSSGDAIYIVLDVNKYGLSSLHLGFGVSDERQDREGKFYSVNSNDVFTLTENGMDTLTTQWRKLPYSGRFEEESMKLFIETIKEHEGIIAMSLLDGFENRKLSQDSYNKFILIGNRNFDADFGRGFDRGL